MPSNYNGSSSGVTAHEQVTIACPVDSDARNAASVNTPLEALADVLQLLQERALLIGETVESANRVLLLATKVTGSDIQVRIYRSATNLLELTRNAVWQGGKWWYDDPSGSPEAVKITMSVAGWWVERYDGATEWSDWGEATILDRPGLRFLNTGAEENPARTVAIANEQRAKNIAKAWGSVYIQDNSIVVLDGFNLKAVSLAGAGSKEIFKVELATPMDDANFAVLVTDDGAVVGSSNSAGVAPRCSARSKDGGSDGVAYFAVAYPGVTDLSTGSWGFNFVVFGKQTT